ncbi:transposase, partial [Methylobrevis pamukkalensis]|uniref:transposase n=1 Tax=Methylobrevis pamukkalensis TaxID=1439726 RepID=UPI00114CDE4A
MGSSHRKHTAKIHALTDRDCGPIAFLLTGGHVADCPAGSLLLQQMPQARILHGDKGYDSNTIRRQVEEKGMMPNIPQGQSARE